MIRASSVWVTVKRLGASVLPGTLPQLSCHGAVLSGAPPTLQPGQHPLLHPAQTRPLLCCLGLPHVCVLSCLVMSNSVWLHGLYSLQAPLSMRFSRQEYWSGLPCPPPGESCRPRDQILHLPHWQAESLPLHHLGNPSDFWPPLTYLSCSWSFPCVLSLVQQICLLLW